MSNEKQFNYQCVKCEAPIDPGLDSCGTGSTWSLYMCSNCHHLHAVGNLPKGVVDGKTTTTFPTWGVDPMDALISGEKPS